MSLPSILYSINTDTNGNGTLVTELLNGWLSEIQVNWESTGNGTLNISADFAGVTEPILTGITGNTDDTYPVTRPLLTAAGADTGVPGYWNLTGQKATAILTGAPASLSPAVKLKFGGSR
jgi:hypothetical protein